jgi:hypothetical protein
MTRILSTAVLIAAFARVPRLAWIGGAVVAGIMVLAGVMAQQRWDAVQEERTQNTINDQRGAITVHETANDVLRDIRDDDPDCLLRRTNGLRDDTGGPC